ncbi:MAG: hypothetical protein IRZ16_01355 [Myxococcaceae bacterium]|nr:hypothetical protein [Myxococcaceae bacterium]
MRTVAAGVVLAVLFVGCGPDPKDRAKLSVLQKEVFTPSCASSSCHGGANPVEGLDLREGKTLASTVNVDSHLQTGTKRIVPGDAENSLLFQVVSGTATDVQRMPANAPPLDDADIEAIRLWIEAGARVD